MHARVRPRVQAETGVLLPGAALAALGGSSGISPWLAVGGLVLGLVIGVSGAVWFYETRPEPTVVGDASPHPRSQESPSISGRVHTDPTREVGIPEPVAGDRAVEPEASASSSPSVETARENRARRRVSAARNHRADPAMPAESGPPEGSAPEGSARDIEAERRLIDAAHASVSRGHAVEALRTVERHRREFPDGQLSEEREAVRIRSLIALGRSDDARSAMGAFRTSFPGRALWPSLSEAMGEQR